MKSSHLRHRLGLFGAFVTGGLSAFVTGSCVALTVAGASLVSGCTAESGAESDGDTEGPVSEAEEAVTYTTLGGFLAPGSGAGASSWGSGRLDVFVRGGNDGLYHRASTDSGISFSNWEYLGGTLSSDPAAVSWGPGRIDVVMRGGTQLWHKAYAGNAWSDWDSLGGTCSSGPAIASWGFGRLDVFVNGGTQLWHKAYAGNAWSDWDSLGSATGGFTSDPAAVSWGPNRLDVFVRGSDNQLYHRFWTPSVWSAWESLGGTLSSGPTVSSDAVGHLDVFVRGGDQMWRKSYRAEQGFWTDWISLGPAMMTSDPEAIASAKGRVSMFGRGGDGSLVHSPGPFISVPDQMPTDRIATFNHYHNSLHNPPVSYGRDVGTVPDSCPDGQEKELALCYPKCGPGYHGRLDRCWADCPSGYTDMGLTCQYTNGPALTSCTSFSGGVCQCPPNYTNAGLLCGANSFSNTWSYRGAGTPLVCRPDLENDAGLCHTPCDPGYNGVGPVCWLDKIDTDAACAALYDPTLAATAQSQAQTLTFGFGVGVAAGLGVAAETGVVYGRGGEYGCYVQGCFVQVTDVALQAWGSFGVYDLPFSGISGDSTVVSAGVSIDPAGVSQGLVYDVDGVVVGGATNVSLGLSLSPYTAGISECTASVRQIW